MNSLRAGIAACRTIYIFDTMISATPNSVRWDQVNRVSYRFQALNFQSDVLEALVLNSPPLTRRTRRKSIIRVVNSSGDRVEFLQAKSLDRRSQSFDEGLTNLTKNDTKFCEKVRFAHDQYEPKRNDVRGLSMDTRQKHRVVIECSSDVEDELDVSPKLVKDPPGRNTVERVIKQLECDCGKKSQFSDCDIFSENSDEDLENRSKEYLIQLVKELRNKVRDLSKIDNSEASSVVRDLHQDCSPRYEKQDESRVIHNGFGEERARVGMCSAYPIANVAFNHQDCMAINMKQLESEVIRTRKIASMFEDELSGLKSKFSTLLGTTNTPEKKSALPLNSQRNNLENSAVLVSKRADSNENWLNLNLDSYQSKSEKAPCWTTSSVAEVTIPDDMGTSRKSVSEMLPRFS